MHLLVVGYVLNKIVLPDFYYNGFNYYYYLNYTNTYNTIYYYLQICCHNNIIRKSSYF